MVAAARDEEPGPDSLYKYLSVFSEVFGLAQQAYVEEAEPEEMILGAYEGVADALDAFSFYVAPEEVALFRELEADGASDAGLFLIRDRGWLYVAGVLEGSPADGVGIQRGDVLTRIQDRSTRELEVWRVKSELARQSRASESVEVEVLRRGERQRFRLDLTEFEVPALIRETVDGSPLLRPAHFETGVDNVWRTELERLGEEGADELVVDLRGVATSEVEGAFAVADLFGEGTLGSLQRRGVVEKRFDSREEPAWQGDLVVLVDRGTLGGAELLANILAGTVDAPVVGESTYGWAGHRARVELRSGAVLQITDGFYAGPDGEIIDESLEPDYEIRDLWRRIGNREREIDDLILERGLEVLRGDVAEDESRAA